MLVNWRGFLQVYCIAKKSQATKSMIEYFAFMERQAGVKIEDLKVVRADNGGEFTGEEFRGLLLKEGIRLQTSTQYSPFQNGIAERGNRTVGEMATAMIVHTGLPHYLWEYAVRHAVRIRNMVTSKANPVMTPHEIVYGVKPDLSTVKRFGERVIVLKPAQTRRKSLRFAAKRQYGRYVGHDSQRKAVCVYVKADGPPTIVYSRDVVFSSSGTDLPTPNVDEVDAFIEDVQAAAEEERANDEGNVGGLTERRRSERIAAREEGKQIGQAFIVVTEVICEPLNMAEARRSPHWNRWDNSVRVELGAIKGNNTYELVDAPDGVKVLRNTIQFRIKQDAAGNIVQYKARVCVRGDEEIYGIHYQETYAPVATITSVRVFFAITVQRKMLIRQADVPTAFCKALLKEDIYVHQVKGYEQGRSQARRLCTQLLSHDGNAR